MCVCVCVCLSVSLSLSVRLSVSLFVRLSASQQVFSRAVSAVGTERGIMDKHHGRSVQQETGAALATERRLAIPRGVH